MQHGVQVEVLRAVDHDIATGVYIDMTEHGWASDAWPRIFEQVLENDILVVAGPIWLGDNSSITKKIIERLYAGSSLTNASGQYLYYGRVAGAIITGNEDGIKHCSSNILYSLQHIGYTIPPQADCGWIGEAGPGPSYLDPGSGGPENEFTQRNTTFMTWNLMHLAALLKRRVASPSAATSAPRGTPARGSTTRTLSTAEARTPSTAGPRPAYRRRVRTTGKGHRLGARTAGIPPGVGGMPAVRSARRSARLS